MTSPSRCTHKDGTFISQSGHEKCLKCKKIVKRNVGDGE